MDNVGSWFLSMYIGLKLSFQYNAERATVPDYRVITRVQCTNIALLQRHVLVTEEELTDDGGAMVTAGTL